MKDLKHLFYFENLLEEVYNEEVRRAKSDGLIAIGSVCSLIPEPLVNLPGTFAVRLRAPRTGSIEMGSYYLSSMLCEGCRAILERAIEGGFEFLDCILAPDACAQMNRCVENIERQKLICGDKFFVTYADVPMKSDETALRHYVGQMKEYVLKPLNEVYGIDTSDEALLKAVKDHNEICELIRKIGDYRKEEKPRITGYEFAVLTLATYACPKAYIKDKLKETLEELKDRQPDEKQSYRARVALFGSEIDNPQLIKLIEDAGALVVADRYCLGSLPGRDIISLDENEDPLTGICRNYMEKGKCPRFMNTEKIQERQVYADQIAREYKAEGLIYQQIKFCDYWGYERASAFHIMREEYGYPVLSLDRPYAIGTVGQLRTRVQAFCESLEIKRLAGDIKKA